MQKLISEQRAKDDRRAARPKTIAASVFTRALAEVDIMGKTGDWSAAGPRHLVALYDRMHQRCYGVVAEELTASARHKAALMAGNLVKRNFAGSVVDAVEFVVWVWEREANRERIRRETGQETRRIGPWLMFAPSFLLTDFRAAQHRR
jgi:hypothetical protein